MLFNSYEFLFLFLPLTLVVFFVIGSRGHHRAAISWLVGASLFFYGWWNAAYLGLLIGSVLFNYLMGVLLSDETSLVKKKWFLIFGITVNLGLLGYFKYANFFVDNLNLLAGIGFNLHKIVLPLAISFFTFQQITYLVDTYRGETKEYNFLHYCLFVTFFPQLIAGPIVHHKEMLPQFSRNALYKMSHQHLAVGLTIFTLGLFKKVVLADGIAVYATPIFAAADDGNAIRLVESWTGALSYTFQLYFDFSGYSDMAIGIARMFGIRLPLNFNSPYRSTNIIDFWRRWHITLSRFLRDYLYKPLGGNRKGTGRTRTNLMITMLLGGLWHGAGWNFVIWGGLHGFYLMVNHGWRFLFQIKRGKQGNKLGWAITFIAVVFAWVPFRATSLDGTLNMWKGMVGLNGIVLDKSLLQSLGVFGTWLNEKGVVFDTLFQTGISNTSILWVLALMSISVLFPNTQQIMRRYRPAYETYRNEVNPMRARWLEWRPSFVTLTITLILLFLSLLSMSTISEFLYFNF